jgi:uncharacterized protein YndB with AHSA1/START domain
MADILHEVVIQAPPAKVYEAITQQAGLASWWTTHSIAKPEVGSTSEFGFEGGKVVFRMDVAKLEPQHVSWNVRQGAPDWGDTIVTWDLTPQNGGTKVLFGHRGFASTDGSFANTNYNWAWFLTSLKTYVETGKGMPVSY